jgi:hypothetical protein
LFAFAIKNHWLFFHLTSDRTMWDQASTHDPKAERNKRNVNYIMPLTNQTYVSMLRTDLISHFNLNLNVTDNLFMLAMPLWTDTCKCARTCMPNSMIHDVTCTLISFYYRN